MATKKCTSCGKRKQLSQYYLKTNGQHKTACKTCARQKAVEVQRASNKRWNAANRDKINARKRARYWAKKAQKENQ